MDLQSAVLILQAGAAIKAFAASFTELRNWFSRIVQLKQADPELVEALRRLPSDADADAVATAIKPFFDRARGGNVSIEAGRSGGGSIHLREATFEAGSSPNAGGDVMLRAGDGGADGSGGDIHVVGGTYKAGDAK